MTLYLLPNLLDSTAAKASLPAEVEQIIPALNGLVAESEKGARTYLKMYGVHLPIWLLNEHTHVRDIKEFIDNFKGNWGLISDAGLPCLADPGSNLVLLAKQKKINP